MIALLLLLACSPPGDLGHGHDHGPGGSHPHEAASDGLAITRWTAGHELFAELDQPVAGQRFAYHAHVTALSDNQPATSGTFGLRFDQEGFAVESHTDPAVARPGIFSGTAPAPGEPGVYELVFTWVDGEARAEWPGGTVHVGDGGAVSTARVAEGEIAFLKESQWQVPFATALAAERELAPALSAPALVQAAPDTTTIVAAPVEGLLAWSGSLPVVGRQVKRGERLATLIPAGAAEHWSRMQADLATARVDQGLADKELARVEALAARDLLPERRLEEARASVERAAVELAATERRVSALTSGGAGALSIRAPADGLIVSVGADHGVAVSAGTPLVSVAAGPAVLIEGHVHDRGRSQLDPVRSVWVFRGDWPAPRELPGARVLTERLVFDATTLSAPLSVLVDDDVGLSPGDLVELHIAVGQTTARLAIPRGAVVEINGQDVVFVQTTGESFTRRRVTLGVRDATHVEVLRGLTPGERVVVQGGFDVHVASLTGTLESHRH